MAPYELHFSDSEDDYFPCYSDVAAYARLKAAIRKEPPNIAIALMHKGELLVTANGTFGTEEEDD